MELIDSMDFMDFQINLKSSTVVNGILRIPRNSMRLFKFHGIQGIPWDALDVFGFPEISPTWLPNTNKYPLEVHLNVCCFLDIQFWQGIRGDDSFNGSRVHDKGQPISILDLFPIPRLKPLSLQLHRLPCT